MGLTHTHITRKKYDEKELWEVYMSWGSASSHKKLREWLLSEKGIKASQMGAFWAMWRYAVKNPKEAYSQYKKWYFDSSVGKFELVEENGQWVEKPVKTEVSFEDFLEDCRKHAKNKGCILSKPAYRRFCAEHGLEE